MRRLLLLCLLSISLAAPSVPLPQDGAGEAPSRYAAFIETPKASISGILVLATVDGEVRIAQGLPFGSSVTDRLAPFGRGADLRYVAVTRTTDGDWAESDDLGYTLDCGLLRFDWGNGQSVALPYNIEESTAYEKGYQEETALDGGIIGWWDGSARRRSALKTALIKLKSAEEQEAVASMARYPGPVFVRTPSGAAFAANVVPGEVSQAYDSGAVSVSIDCAETALTSEHMPSGDDIARPEWGGGPIEEIGGAVFDSAGLFPMDDWTFLGYSGQVLYATDADGAIYDGSGAEMEDWEWDGDVLLDDQGNDVPLTQEAGQ